MDDLTLRTMIVMLLEGFPSSALSVTDGTVAAYVNALHGVEPQHIRTALGRFLRGQVDRFDHNKAPSAAEVAREAQSIQFDAQRAAKRTPQIEAPPKGYATTPDGRALIVPIGREMPDGFATIGPTKMNFGHGDIDMSWMSPEEKHRVLVSNGKDVPKREERKSLVA